MKSSSACRRDKKPEPHSRVGTRFLEAVVERCGVPAGGLAGVCAGAARRRNETAADEACRRKVGV